MYPPRRLPSVTIIHPVYFISYFIYVYQSSNSKQFSLESSQWSYHLFMSPKHPHILPVILFGIHLMFIFQSRQLIDYLAVILKDNEIIIVFYIYSIIFFSFFALNVNYLQSTVDLMSVRQIAEESLRGSLHGFRS